MTVLGNVALVLSLVASIASAFTYYRNTSSGRRNLSVSRRLASASAFLVALASILLLTLILRHDYSNGYVFSYSDNSLPLHYLISTFYAGQEGSFLFWGLCSVCIALVLRRFSHRHGNEDRVMAAYMAVQSMLLILAVAKSPFQSLWQMFPQAPLNQIPVDGRGLNPLLQNMWMVIHPPVLFIGFAAMAVPFSLAIAGLWKKEFDILSSQGIPWVLFATAVLGLGIMLGAYWAYGVLGWGGYWGWDPVENSSLVPWLVGIALLHTMLAQLRTGKYLRTNFVLAQASFFLVIYSTFLTRSGILGDASVHSFTDPGAAVYWLLLALLAGIGLTGFAMMYIRRKEMVPQHSDVLLLTRETSLGAGSIVLMLSAAVILFGTSLPIFSKTRVEPSFYDTTNLPVAIAICLLVGYSLYTQWEIQDGLETLRRSLKTLIGSLSTSAVLFYFGVRDPLALFLVFASVFALLVNVEIGVKVARGDPRFLGGKLAHIGVALFFLAVISTGKYGSSLPLELPLNLPKQALGYTLTYTGYSPTADGKFAFHVVVEGRGDKFTLSPVMFDAGQQGLMRNPAIQSFLTRDIYLSPKAIQEQSAAAGAQESYTLAKGQTVSMGNVRATFLNFDMRQHGQESGESGDGSMAIGSVLELSNGGRLETVTPVAIYKKDEPPQYKLTESKLMNASIQLVSMNVGTGSAQSTVTVEVRRPNTAKQQAETLLVEVSTKPFISLLWAGTLVMMGGFVLSIVKRSKEA